MKRTLVLAVDRDDDYGVKGRVSTPVIGVDNCISAVNSLGIADPEDSDVNAVYAAISTCLDLQEEGFDAEVALICGNEKVGHKSDLDLVSELEMVLDEIQPDNVVLVGDGAEDEYIYPIISSRSHVDSVRRVYVKQAQNIESSFYVITKMLSEPNKRKRFIAPIGAIIVIVSIFLFLPDLVVYITSGDIGDIPKLSRDMMLFIVGTALLMYAYGFGNRWENFNVFLKEKIFSRATRLMMTSLAIGILVISLVVCFYQMGDTFYKSWPIMVASYISMMIWPAMMSLLVYIFGIILDEAQEESAVRLSNLFDCMSIGGFGVMMTGLVDIVLFYMGADVDPLIGIVEVLLGLAISIAISFIKKQYRPAGVVG
jgi:putative membrane protein